MRLPITLLALEMLAAVASARESTAADAELGKYLAAECLGCHRAQSAAPAIPMLFGMNELRITEQLRGYRERRFANPVMQAIAERLTDEDIASLAQYFAAAQRP
jgi:cytochrome c553